MWSVHEYDTTLKALLTRPGSSALAALTGCTIESWHNVELPSVRSPRVDLLGETGAGELVHIELQSRNDPAMVLRMAEYAMAIHRSLGRWPQQFVLYAGQPEMAMPSHLETPALSFRCRIIDIRELDGEVLLNSPRLEDNLLAILTRLADERAAIQRILERIAGASHADRALALKQLTIIAGLRKLELAIGQETHNMPILDDIMDHDLFGPAIRKGIAQGMERGLEQGLEQGIERGMKRGMKDGELLIVTNLIRRRFGPISDATSQRLEALTPAQIEALSLRILDARTLEDLFA
jgi:hypothetical protein